MNTPTLSAREAIEDALVDLFDAPAHAITAAADALAALPQIAGLVEAARRLAALEHEDGGRSFPTREDCAFARQALQPAPSRPDDGGAG